MTGEEIQVQSALANAGFETLVPQVLLAHRCGGVWRAKSRCAIPGYVFIRADAGANGMDTGARIAIGKARGVIRIVGARGPEEIPDSQMEIVRLLRGQGNLITMRENGGRRICELHGELKSAGAHIVWADMHARRAAVEIWLMGRRHEIRLGIFET